MALATLELILLLLMHEEKKKETKTITHLHNTSHWWGMVNENMAFEREHNFLQGQVRENGAIGHEHSARAVQVILVYFLPRVCDTLP